MRFFNLLLLILFFYPIQLSGENSPADLLLTADGINCSTEYSGNIRHAPNPLWDPGDFIDGKGVQKSISADYIKNLKDKLYVSFRQVYYNGRVSIDSHPEKGFFERNIKLFLLLAGLLLLVSLLIFSNISILKQQVRKKTAELQKTAMA
ncbi:MAG: hypothetical protein U5K32_07235 [Bacteroidales bacterium]|nr:hypothetical protein [Bacteroidales bacterium]